MVLLLCLFAIFMLMVRLIAWAIGLLVGLVLLIILSPLILLALIVLGIASLF